MDVALAYRTVVRDARSSRPACGRLSGTTVPTMICTWLSGDSCGRNPIAEKARSVTAQLEWVLAIIGPSRESWHRSVVAGRGLAQVLPPIGGGWTLQRRSYFRGF